MWVEFVHVLGNIEYKEHKIGRALLFNVVDEDYTFDCMLYVQRGQIPFVTIHDEDNKYSTDDLLKIIVKKYTIEELLKV